MRVGEPTTVVVELGTSSLPPLTSSGPGPTVVVPISTTCEVEAQLTAAPGTFEIAPSGYQPMSFLNASVVTWTWQVTPSEAGKGLQLELDVNSLFQETGAQPIPGSVRSYTASITVAATTASLARRASGIFNSPLFDTLLGASIPIVVAALVAYRKRRRRSSRKAEAEPLEENTVQAARPQAARPDQPAAVEGTSVAERVDPP